MARRSNDDEEREDRIRAIMERAKRLQEQAAKVKKPSPVTRKVKKSTHR